MKIIYLLTKQCQWFSVTVARSRKLLYLIVLLTACTDFVEVDLPKNQLSAEAVFEDLATVEAALRGIYYEMRTNGLLSGDINGLNVTMGLYTDELDYYLLGQGLAQENYQNHTLTAVDPISENSWNSSYNQIYKANDIIEGVGNSVSLTTEDRDQFKGEALFIRAYLHLLLVELYGDIPYITTTDYITNTIVARIPKALVYDQIILDLTLATGLLADEDISGERVRPYRAVAEAVLARAYLYAEGWVLAEVTSNKVITKFGTLEPDLNKVFLKEASGSIWQFKSNSDGNNTSEGGSFVFISGPPSDIALSNVLFNAFESGDQRQSLWIGTVTNSQGTWYHPFKYKERFSTGTASVEYSVQLRLAEQYLIRAEARVQRGNLSGAQADINAVRNRAGLSDTTAVTLNELLDAILQERRVELFTEMGHRWFDLKRMGKAKEVLSPIKSNWKDTDILFPIPDTELALNPNLLPQNDGY